MKKLILTIAVLFAAGSTAFANENGAEQTENPCIAGYQWYKDQNACIRKTERTFAVAEKCTPGETRRVPDPNNPKKFKIQECGYVKGE